MIKRIVTPILALIAAGWVYAADPLGDAIKAYDAGQYQQAVTLLKPLAEAGDSVAQLRLGMLYYYGNGVPEDESAAVAWLTRSASQGNLDAMYHIGNILTFGVDTAKLSADADLDAVKWYFTAARAGHADAQYALGLMFLAGKGVIQSREEGIAWIRRAAALGHREALSFVGGLGPNEH
jgi:uncharacterized protein